MLIGLSVWTALEVHIWSNFNISTDSSKTVNSFFMFQHKTLLEIITFLFSLFWNLGKFDEKNKDSKVYSFVFLLLFTNLMKTAKIPILHHTVMKDILINTPKVRQSNKTQNKQTK